MNTLSIYDAHKLKLSENDPLVRILFYAYECHMELREDVARKAASLLGFAIDECDAIKQAEEKLDV